MLSSVQEDAATGRIEYGSCLMASDVASANLEGLESSIISMSVARGQTDILRHVARDQLESFAKVGRWSIVVAVLPHRHRWVVCIIHIHIIFFPSHARS